MGVTRSNPTDSATSKPGPAFGPAVWGWGLAGGVALWFAGFLLLPLWAALLLWWWPSILFGAAVAFLAIGLAELLARKLERRQGAARNRRGGRPSG